MIKKNNLQASHQIWQIWYYFHMFSMLDWEKPSTEPWGTPEEEMKNSWGPSKELLRNLWLVPHVHTVRNASEPDKSSSSYQKQSNPDKHSNVQTFLKVSMKLQKVYSVDSSV